MLKVRAMVTIYLLLCLTLTMAPSHAANKLAVAVNQSQVLAYNNVERVAIANPDIADVVVISGSEVLLVGKVPGVTTLHIWTLSGRYSYEVEVAADDLPVANSIKSILNYPDIRVSKVNKTIVLEGTVNDHYQKKRAESVAGAYAEKVINLLEITRPVQVKLEAKIIEINREKIQNLGIKWGNSPATGTGNFSFGQSFAYSNQTIGGNPFGRLGGFADINGLLEALVKDGIARILSQPNMITLSGSKANILVGGEIPVPVALDNGKITIEWKQYGIQLEVEPEANGEGLINSRVKAEVSSLDWNSPHRIELGAGLKIPPFKTRKAESAIALSSGQTMAIGGLIATETTHDVYKVPLLADIPILGNLFKSKSFNRGETELLILVTPTIVNPADYSPDTTADMKITANENPWGGKENGRTNQGAYR